MRKVVDQMNRSIEVPALPQRIISLVPSQTELLASLGLGDRVVGITKFCIHPESWRKEKMIIGGTKQFRMEVIEQLQPDLIIGNKEENYQEGIEALASKYPVWLSDIISVEDSLEMIRQIGVLVGETTKANALAYEIHQSLPRPTEKLKPKALYLIWKNPYMAAGQGTFINEMLQAAGFQNILTAERYPSLTEAEITALQPEYILLSSEPFPFKEKHIEELRMQCPNSEVHLVDGELFSWYGSRLLKSAAYFNTLLK